MPLNVAKVYLNISSCVTHFCIFVQVKKQYEKAYREQEKAIDAFRKADADINLSRAEVEKVRIY